MAGPALPAVGVSALSGDAAPIESGVGHALVEVGLRAHDERHARTGVGAINDQVRAAVERYFPPSEWATAMRIAKCESGYQPWAVEPGGAHLEPRGMGAVGMPVTDGDLVGVLVEGLLLAHLAVVLTGLTSPWWPKRCAHEWRMGVIGGTNVSFVSGVDERGHSHATPSVPYRRCARCGAVEFL